MKVGDETMFVPHAVVERNTGWYKYRECIRLSRAERKKLK